MSSSCVFFMMLDSCIVSKLMSAATWVHATQIFWLAFVLKSSRRERNAYTFSLLWLLAQHPRRLYLHLQTHRRLQVILWVLLHHCLASLAVLVEDVRNLSWLRCPKISQLHCAAACTGWFSQLIFGTLGQRDIRENHLWNTLSNTYPMSYILSKILSDILSDMLSDLLSDTLSNMMDGWQTGYPWMAGSQASIHG